LKLLIILGFLFLQGCTHLAIEDCGGKVLGENEPRIRSSHFRMLLADLPAASERFSPYAAMSALAYVDRNCGTESSSITDVEQAKLELYLSAKGWQEVKDVKIIPPCEDDVGMFFRVWKHDADTTDMVISFRGTEGFKDWLYGNSHWVTRFLPMEDQYFRARKAVQQVLDRFSKEGSKTVRFYTTGHSLGGGLAQHILYTYPKQVIQTLAFDPSSVTGFMDQTPINQISACGCSSQVTEGETRIYRVYDAYEILSNLRIFHKIFFPPERHIQEVRFPNAATHSMSQLAVYLLNNATSSSNYSNPWFSGKGNYSSGESCTAAFIRSQHTSCEIKVTQDDWNKCPQ
jgi:Lipase (class 3)